MYECHKAYLDFAILQIHVIELGPYKAGNFALHNTYDHIQYYDDTDHYDFPVSLHVSLEQLFIAVVPHAFVSA